MSDEKKNLPAFRGKDVVPYDEVQAKGVRFNPDGTYATGELRRRTPRKWLFALVGAAVIALLALGGLVACNNNSPVSSSSVTPYPIGAQGAIEAISCDNIAAVRDAVQTAADANNSEALTKWGLAGKDIDTKQALNGPVKENGFGNALERLKTVVTKCDAQKVAATAADCPDGTPLSYDPNRDYNVVTDKDGDGVAVSSVQEDLAAIKSDPKNLAYRAHNLKLWDNPNEWESLTSNGGKCLSTDGEILFAKVEGALTASSTRVDENGTAPAGFFNTGMSSSGPVVNSVSGITGNLDAIVYTLADGTKVIVLKRCGNLALPSAPASYVKVNIPGSGGGTPPGKTTPPGTTPPGQPQCPPGQTGTPPLCKDEESAGPAHNPNLPDQQRPNPLPASPEMAQPTRPASPPQTYVPPAAPTVVTPAPSAGGPTPIETPRNTPTPEPEAPASTAPQTSCIPSPGKTTC